MTRAVQAQGGAYLGLVKGNQPEVKAVVDDGVAEAVFSPPHGTTSRHSCCSGHLVGQTAARERLQERLQRGWPALDVAPWDQGHGWLEYQERWLVAAADLGPALAAEWGWQGVSPMGLGLDYRQRTSAAQWTVEEHTFVTSHADVAPTTVLQQLRGHWTLENRVHPPRDVRWREDRTHGHASGALLA